MAHVILIGDEAQCAPIRDQLVQWGLTVASPAIGAPTPVCVGVDACDVVLMVGVAAADCGPVAGSDGGWGAAPAAPRLFLADDFRPDGAARDLWPRLQEACRQARCLRGGCGPTGSEDGQDVHQVGHELRSPLTVIKTALEVMEGDLRTWHAEPADVEAQLKMLQIALRNVRRLHRAVEWSQMLLAGPRSEGEPLVGAPGAAVMAPVGPEGGPSLQASESSAA